MLRGGIFFTTCADTEFGEQITLLTAIASSRIFSLFVQQGLSLDAGKPTISFQSLICNAEEKSQSYLNLMANNTVKMCDHHSLVKKGFLPLCNTEPQMFIYSDSNLTIKTTFDILVFKVYFLLVRLTKYT